MWEKQIAEAKKALEANKRSIEYSSKGTPSGKASDFKRKAPKPKGKVS